MSAIYSFYGKELQDFKASADSFSYIFTILAICFLPIVALIVYEIEEARSGNQAPIGYRRIGQATKSYLDDDLGGSSAEGLDSSTENWKLKSIWIYPVKSCRGVELEEGTVLATGMKFDRLFTFAQLRSPFPVAVDASAQEKADHKWEFITQRQFPQLAQVKTQIWVENESASTRNSGMRGTLILSYPHQERGWKGLLAKYVAFFRGTVPEKHWKIPLNPTAAQIKTAGYKLEPIIIWKDTITALSMEIDIPAELRLFLGASNKLGFFRIDESHLREVHRNAPTKEQLGYQPVTGFQDAYPLHLLNIASVRNLKDQIPDSTELPRLSIQRFRANFIVSGPEAYEEDHWKRVMIGNFEFDVSCRTARCKMPNIDHETGERHPSEPDRTLRKQRAIDNGAGPNIGCLGMQLVPILERSEVKVGDKIRVLSTGEHCYIKQ